MSESRAATVAPPRLTPEDAAALLRTATGEPVGPRDGIGIEVEWHVVDPADPMHHVPAERVREALGGTTVLPGGARVTFEPGGQVELSSATETDLGRCLFGLQSDARLLRSALQAAGLTLLEAGVDPHRAPYQVLHTPRYDAMAAHWQRAGCSGAGRVMMTSTAAVQVNVGLGDDAHERWVAAHRIGPTLLAAFACSPFEAGVDTGWVSNRHRAWVGLEACRTTAVAGEASWADYALDATVMLLGPSAEPSASPQPVRFRDWLDRPAALGRPADADDLAVHVTTLFPPVRPRGWLEIRYLDCSPQWPVASAVVVTLVTHPEARARAIQACATVGDAWTIAAQVGVRDPALREAAQACLAAAADVLDPEWAEAVRSFRAEYVDAGRCPADDECERTA